jgi:hypothetical protein
VTFIWRLWSAAHAAIGRNSGINEEAIRERQRVKFVFMRAPDAVPDFFQGHAESVGLFVDVGPGTASEIDPDLARIRVPAIP